MLLTASLVHEADEHPSCALSGTGSIQLERRFVMFTLKENIIDWLQCSLFVGTIFAISTAIVLFANYLDKVIG